MCLVTDAQLAPFPTRHRADRSDGVIDLVEALHEALPGLGQRLAARMALEQADAKVLLQRPHLCADPRLTNAKRIRGMAEVHIFGDGQSLNQSRHWKTPTAQQRRRG
jgi:hypothetical protein